MLSQIVIAMKKLSLYIFLVLMWCNVSLSDDIRDFKIEGISIGDSLLDYFSKDEILDNTHIFCENCKPQNKFSEVMFLELPSSFKTYSSIRFIIQNDKKYIIHGIEGAIFYGNNIDDCYAKQNETDEVLSKIFEHRETETRKIGEDKSEKSIAKNFHYWNTGHYSDNANNYCTDWNSEMKMPNYFTVTIMTEKLERYIIIKDF